MDYLPKRGRLERNLKNAQITAIPKSETVQTIEVTKKPDGTIMESDDYIASEKERKLLALKERYGAIDETQITWIKIKKEQASSAV